MTRPRMFSLSVSLNLLVSGIVLIGRVAPNVKTTFKPDVAVPVIAKTAGIHPLAAVDGSVIIGEHVFRGHPFAETEASTSLSAMTATYKMASSCMDSKRSRGL